MYYYQQSSQPPPPPTYESVTDQYNGIKGDSNLPANSQHPLPGQPMANVYSQPTQPGQPFGTAYSQLQQYGQQTIPGQQPYNGQPMPGQPIMTQPVLMQNQYGQPFVVQSSVQPIGAVQMPLQVDPHNPNQNEQSVRMKCPHCQSEVTTTTNYVVGGCTWLWCILLALMGCVLCCCLPFLWNGSKDVVHTCPNCKKEVGRFNRQQRSNIRIQPSTGGHRRHRRRRR